MKLKSLRSDSRFSCAASSALFGSMGTSATSIRPQSVLRDPRLTSKVILGPQNLWFPLHSCLVFAPSLSHNLLNGPPARR